MDLVQCGLVHVSHCELFAKIPSLPLALAIAFFKSLRKIHDHCVRIGTKTAYVDSFRCLNAPVLWTQSNKACAEQHLLYQFVYRRLCSSFRHSWIPPQGTWRSPPATVFCHLLAAYTALGFRKEVIPRSLQCWFHSGLVARSSNRSSVRRRPCSEDTKSSVKSKRLILQLPTLTPPWAWMWLSLQCMQTMKKSCDST